MTDPFVQTQLDAFLKKLESYAEYTSTLPPPHTWASNVTGSVTVEWFLTDRRIAFTFCPDARDSGWHVVIKGGSMNYGVIPDDLSEVFRIALS